LFRRHAYSIKEYAVSRNGSGGYSLPSNTWNPAVSGVSATPADWQALINDVATAIQQSISADGQTPITGNLQMGGNRLTGLSAGVATGQSLRFEQLFSQGALTDIASAGTTDIGAQLSNFLRVTGTTGISSFGTNYNGPRFLIFSGVVTLTHSATLVLPGSANITTAANDALIAIPISGGWQVVAYQRSSGLAFDYLNTSRLDVASATTVDLTASAPNTRNINITGTTTIAGFTVAVGQTYFVRFNASLTLTNSASLVTQTGASLVTSAGDTCIIRSTSANTVELLSYVKASGNLIQNNSFIRQTVIAGPVDTNGFAAFGGSTGSTTVTAAGTLTATASNGVAGDRTGSIVNPAWTGLSTNGSIFLYLDIAANGTCTTGSTTLSPIYRWGGADVTTNNQATFNIQEMQMKVGNGATAAQTYRVFVGEVTVSGAVVTAITWYALMGRYYNGALTLPTSGTVQSYNHNIGLSKEHLDSSVNLRCIATDSVAATGEILDMNNMYTVGSLGRGFGGFSASRNAYAIKQNTVELVGSLGNSSVTNTNYTVLLEIVRKW
jgi:hypothetical protein